MVSLFKGIIRYLKSKLILFGVNLHEHRKKYKVKLAYS